MSDWGPAAPDPTDSDLAQEVRRGQDRAHPIRRRVEQFQAWSHRGSTWRRMAVRGSIALLGFCLFVAGVAMLVLPGPGWVFIFLGIGVWSMEFDWAHRLNQWALRHLSRWWAKWRSTPIVRWWRWCTSGARERSTQNQRAAVAQAAGRPVRCSPHNAAPGS